MSPKSDDGITQADRDFLQYVEDKRQAEDDIIEKHQHDQAEERRKSFDEDNPHEQD